MLRVLARHTPDRPVAGVKLRRFLAGHVQHVVPVALERPHLARHEGERPDRGHRPEHRRRVERGDPVPQRDVRPRFPPVLREVLVRDGGREPEDGTLERVRNLRHQAPGPVPVVRHVVHPAGHRVLLPPPAVLPEVRHQPAARRVAAAVVLGLTL